MFTDLHQKGGGGQFFTSVQSVSVVCHDLVFGVSEVFDQSSQTAICDFKVVFLPGGGSTGSAWWPRKENFPATEVLLDHHSELSHR